MSFKSDAETLAGVPVGSASTQVLYLDSVTGKWRSKNGAATDYPLTGVLSTGTIVAGHIATFADTTGNTLQDGGVAVTSVSGTLPIVSSGGTTPAISISAATTGAAGSLSAADKTKLDSVTSGAAVSNVTGTAPIVSSGGTTPAISLTTSPVGQVPVGVTRQVATSAPLTGGGALSADLTLAISAATTSAAGSMSAADKSWVQNTRSGMVNILDYGADNTGTTDIVTPLTNAVAALPNGGIVFFPSGTYKLSTFTCSTAGITFLGASRNGTSISGNSTTNDLFVVNQWFNTFQNLTLTTSVTKSAGYVINSATGQSYTRVFNCEIVGGSSSLTLFNGIQMGAGLMEIDEVEMRFFSNIGVNVNGQSDHRINRLICDNAVQAVAGIQVNVTASLMISNCNIIHSGNALDITPGAGGTIPSIECINTFFDTSTNGIRFNPNATGSIFRCKFTNVWCSSHTNAGVLFNASGSNVDGITFVNCDFYGNAYGINVAAAVSKWSVQASRIAGNTTSGINLIPGANHFPQIIGNDIGPVSAFGANATGIFVLIGTYKGLKIVNNNILGNTANATIGQVTPTSGFESSFAITDNPGINPKGSVTTPTFPATAVVVTNTTGYRVSVYLKGGTAVTAITVNGVVTGFVAAAATIQETLILDPGGTISVTFTGTAPTWNWVAN